MKKSILLLLGLFSLVVVHAQVGVNTESPKSTFHVVPAKTDGTTAEGIIAPNLSRAELISKDARYGADQQGAIVYVTAVDGTSNTKVAKITEVGYYFFDGSVWQPFASQTVTIPTEPWLVQGGTTEATGNAQNIYQTGKVAIGTGSVGASAYNLEVAGSSYISGNSRVGSSTVVGSETVAGTLTAGSATALPVGALLGVQTTAPNAGLANSTKGFMYPRLVLEGPVSLAPLVAGGGTVAEKLQHVGLAVYHIGGNGLEEGLCFWNGVQWVRNLTGVPVTTSVIADLKTSVYAPLLSWNEPQNGVALNFGNLEVKEDGSYALMIRFYGQVNEDANGKLLTAMVASSIYVWVFRSGSANAVDAAELAYTCPPHGYGIGQGTYIAAFTAALTVPNAKRGETLTIKIGTNKTYPRFNYYLKAGPAPNAARTSLYYWKL